MEENEFPLSEEISKEILEDVKKSSVKKCVKITPCRSENLSIFQSKFGGVPYWEKDAPYPTDADGNKMVLLAQIRLDEIANFDAVEDLPKSGLLQFFISTNDLFGLDFENPTSQSGHRVIFHENLDEKITKDDVISLKIPTTNDEDFSDYFPFKGEFSLEFSQSESFINDTDFGFFEKVCEVVERIGVKIPEEKYLSEYDILDEDTLEDFFDGSENSRIGGWAFFTQDDVHYREDCRDYEVLLFQMDSTESQEILWGDCGIANFFITKSDLKKRDFSKVLYNWDSY